MWLYIYRVKTKTPASANHPRLHAYTREERPTALAAAFWHSHLLDLRLVSNQPEHLSHGRFWAGDIDDEQVGWLAARFQTIDMLDIYDAPITRASIHYLTKVARLKELRRKDCAGLGDDCVFDFGEV